MNFANHKKILLVGNKACPNKFLELSSSTQKTITSVRKMAKEENEHILIIETQDVTHPMLITDHINMTGENPLIGKNDDTIGARFPDQSKIYQTNTILKFEKKTAVASNNRHISNTHPVSKTFVFCAIIANHAGLDVTGVVFPASKPEILERFIRNWKKQLF